MQNRDRVMVRGALAAAVLTATFCAIFATVMHQIAPMVSLVPVIALSAVSGFLGSLFASLVLKARGKR